MLVLLQYDHNVLVLAWKSTWREPCRSAAAGLVPGAMPSPVLCPTPSGLTVHKMPVLAWNAMPGPLVADEAGGAKDVNDVAVIAPVAATATPSAASRRERLLV